MTIANPDGTTEGMGLDDFRTALDQARQGFVTSELGATDTMLDLLADVAVSSPGTEERTAAISACRAQYRAEAARARQF